MAGLCSRDQGQLEFHIDFRTHHFGLFGFHHERKRVYASEIEEVPSKLEVKNPNKYIQYPQIGIQCIFDRVVTSYVTA